MNSRPLISALSCVLVLQSLVSASPLAAAPADNKIEFVVNAGTHDRKNTPLCLEVSVDPKLKNATAAIVSDDAGNSLAAQLVAPSLLATPADASGGVARELHFVLPQLKAGQTKNFTATISPEPSKDRGQFAWHDTPGQFEELTFDQRPVLRYMYHKLDESSEDSRMATLKVYHHVLDPEQGTELLTKGPGGLWPHHHGVFYGFKEVTYDGDKKCDIWHCPAAFQEHSQFLGEEAGPVLGRQLVEVNWVAEPDSPDTNNKQREGGAPNRTFAKEEREMTAYHVPGGTLLEFASRLRALLPPVHLDGDPQHSGFHFRATNEVHTDTETQTYFLRPDGKGSLCAKNGKGPDETRNWDPKAKNPDKRTVNMPWDAMSVVIGGKRYTVAYLDNEKNPKESRGSEREYGRIGNYFVADVTKDKPLDVNYRLWVQSGEMTVPEVAALDADFDDPPLVAVK
jgi:Methane oxygenase PmoA